MRIQSLHLKIMLIRRLMRMRLSNKHPYFIQNKTNAHLSQTRRHRLCKLSKENSAIFAASHPFLFSFYYNTINSKIAYQKHYNLYPRNKGDRIMEDHIRSWSFSSRQNRAKVSSFSQSGGKGSLSS